MALIPMLLLALTGPVQADSVAMRLPEEAYRAHIGSRGISVGGWPGGNWGLSTTDTWSVSSPARLHPASSELQLAWRHRLGDGDGPWSTTVYLASGPVLPLDTLGLGWSLEPAIDTGFTGQRFCARAAVVVPTAGGYANGWVLTVPALIEPKLGVHIGKVWIVAWAQAGPVLTPGLDMSVRFEPGLAVSFSMPEPRSTTPESP